jgi:hypothetical protein
MHDIDRTQFAVRDREAEGELGPLLDTLRRTGRQGTDWVMIRLALARGISDERRLTDLVFHSRHPERNGRPLQVGERTASTSTCWTSLPWWRRATCSSPPTAASGWQRWRPAPHG